MKHSLLTAAVPIAAALSVLATASAASAQDESPFAGFYVGANVGGTWGNTDNKITAASGTGSVVILPGDVNNINALAVENGNGFRFHGGAEAGYNYQMGALLLGIETDFGFFDLKQSKSSTFQSAALVNPPINITIHQEVTTDWLWTVRPRIGYVGGNWMVYGTGGMAMAPVKLTTTYSDTAASPNVFSASEDATKTGWALGFGGAYAFNPNWSLKAEYLYTDLGRVHASTSNSFATLTTEAQARANIFRLGVDYRF